MVTNFLDQYRELSVTKWFLYHILNSFLKQNKSSNEQNAWRPSSWSFNFQFVDDNNEKFEWYPSWLIMLISMIYRRPNRLESNFRIQNIYHKNMWQPQAATCWHVYKTRLCERIYVAKRQRSCSVFHVAILLSNYVTDRTAKVIIQ